MSSPLIKRYTDEDGNKMVAVAEWFYDGLVESHNFAVEESKRIGDESMMTCKICKKKKCVKVDFLFGKAIDPLCVILRRKR